MTMASPLISIVVPTRDRPNYIKYALQSMAMQSYQNFEVIVCDNYTHSSSKKVFDRYADSRFTYVSPPSPLNMSDNWEYAVSLAKGDFVGVLIDKTVLRPFALDVLAGVIRAKPADAYCWRAEAYYLTNENFGSTGAGYYVPCWNDNESEYIDIASEIERKLLFDVRIGGEGVRYYFGKICFGVYSKALIEKIKARYGRLFPPLSPDYTSMVAAMEIANTMVDIGQTLQVSLNTIVSNGMLAAQSAIHSNKFLRTIDPSLRFLKEYPVPNVYASYHNAIAYDYRLFGGGKTDGNKVQLDIPKLASLVWQDLANVVIWPSERERHAQFGLLQVCLARLTAQDRARLEPRLMSIPPLPETPTRLMLFVDSVRDRLYRRRRKYDRYRDVIQALQRRDVANSAK